MYLELIEDPTLHIDVEKSMRKMQTKKISTTIN
ncbi:MAG: hypothetical protein ACI959_001228 [Limisphaerales bacterium]|jgi:hypothetical protein